MQLIEWTCIPLRSAIAVTSAALCLRSGAGLQISSEQVQFIRNAFPSVWALELFLHAKNAPERAFSSEELVSGLRASDHVVATSVKSLVKVGLMIFEGANFYRYQPASAELERLSNGVAEIYAMRPDFVRRIIVTGGAASAFSDAFRLKRG